MFGKLSTGTAGLKAARFSAKHCRHQIMWVKLSKFQKGSKGLKKEQRLTWQKVVFGVVVQSGKVLASRRCRLEHEVKENGIT